MRVEDALRRRPFDLVSPPAYPRKAIQESNDQGEEQAILNRWVDDTTRRVLACYTGGEVVWYMSTDLSGEQAEAWRKRLKESFGIDAVVTPKLNATGCVLFSLSFTKRLSDGA